MVSVTFSVSARSKVPYVLIGSKTYVLGEGVYCNLSDVAFMQQHFWVGCQFFLRKSLFNFLASKTTTFFEIAEPRNFGLYPQRYIHIGDEINCSNIENWLKFLLKKVSAEKNQNSWKFLKIFIFFPKNFFGHLAGQRPANIFQLFFHELAGQHYFSRKKFQTPKNIKYKKIFFFHKKIKILFC